MPTDAHAHLPKTFLSADQLLADSFELAARIIEDGFRPDMVVGVWRGGTPVGIAVQEVFEVCGLACDHIAIRTAAYTGMNQMAREVRVLGLDYLVETVEAEHSLLIVDDVFDSGRSIAAIIRELSRQARRNTPRDIRVGTVFYKPSKNQTDRVPDYYLHETEDWLVFPHEIEGLSAAELRAHKPLGDRLIDLVMRTRTP
jgi:hypoxanthine phosphoribosyltransferase